MESVGLRSGAPLQLYIYIVGQCCMCLHMSTHIHTHPVTKPMGACIDSYTLAKRNLP